MGLYKKIGVVLDRHCPNLNELTVGDYKTEGRLDTLKKFRVTPGELEIQIGGCEPITSSWETQLQLPIQMAYVVSSILLGHLNLQANRHQTVDSVVVEGEEFDIQAFLNEHLPLEWSEPSPLVGTHPSLNVKWHCTPAPIGAPFCDMSVLAPRPWHQLPTQLPSFSTLSREHAKKVLEVYHTYLSDPIIELRNTTRTMESLQEELQ